MAEALPFHAGRPGVDWTHPTLPSTQTGSGLAAGALLPVEPPLLPAHIELRECVGEGAMGTVWRAWDAKAGCFVAVKVPRRDSPRLLLRFKTEFRTAQRVVHPNLVAVRALYAESGTPAFTMEWVDGSPLHSVVRADDHAWARHLFRQLLDALATVHAAGMVHGDVKGSNCLATDDCRLMLLDFGLARMLGEEHAQLAGTLTHMDPDLLDGGESAPSSDLYAVGVMLYKWLTGRFPVRGSLADQLQGKRALWFSAPDRLVPGVDPVLSALAMDLLHPERGGRPCARQALDRLAGDGESASTLPWVPRVELGRRLNRALRCDGLRPRMVAVVGDSGSGKTSAVRRALSGVRQGVLWGTCSPSEHVAFGGLGALVDGLWLALARRQRWRAVWEPAALEAAVLFPQLGGLVERLEPVRRHHQRKAAAEGLARLLEVVAQDGGLVIVLDDVQWLDPAARAVLRDTWSQLSGPVTLVLVQRGPEPWGPGGLDDVVQVGGVSVEALGQVAADGVGAHLPKEQDRLPAYLLPLVLQVGGRPSSWSDAVRHSIARLHSTARRALVWCSLADAPLRPEHLRALGTQEHAVREAASAGLLRLWTERDGRLVALVHERVGEVVRPRDGDAAADRRALAVVLADDHPRWARAAAGQFEAVDDLEEAGLQWARSGRWSLSRGAWEAAARALFRARELQAPAACWAAPLGSALEALGDCASAIGVWRAVQATADRALQVSLRIRIAETLVGHGQLEEGVEEYARLLSEFGEVLPRSRMAVAWEGLVRPRLWSRPSRSVEPTADQILRLEVLWKASRSYTLLDPLASLALMTRHERLAWGLRVPSHHIRALSHHCWARLAETGQADEVDLEIDALFAVHQDSLPPDDDARIHTSVARGYGRLLSCDWAQAIPELEAAWTTVRRVRGSSWLEASCEGALLEASRFAVPMPNLSERLSSFLSRARSRRDRLAELRVRLSLGYGLKMHQTARPEVAYQDLAEAFQLCDPPPSLDARIRHACALGCVHVAAGDGVSALAHVDGQPMDLRAMRRMRYVQMVFDSVVVRGLLLTPRRTWSQERRLRQVLRALRQMGGALCTGLARAYSAAWAIQRGDETTARIERDHALAAWGDGPYGLLKACLVGSDDALLRWGVADPTFSRRAFLGAGAEAVHTLPR